MLTRLILIMALLPSVASAGGLQASFQGSRLKMTKPYTLYEYNGTTNGDGDLVDVSGAITWPDGTSKSQYDMSATGTHAKAASNFTLGTGVRVQSPVYNNSDTRHSVAHQSIFGIWDGDFTVTVVFMQDSGATQGGLFGQSQLNTGGIRIFDNTSVVTMSLHKSGGSINVNSGAGDVDDEAWHVVQAQRCSDTATVYYDGVAGAQVDVTGYGVDVVDPTDVGSLRAAAYFGGKILYVRADAQCLSDDERNRDLQTIQGIVSSHGEPWVVDRNSSGFREISSGLIVDEQADKPRISGRRLLIEAQSTNTIFRSEALDNVVYANTRMSITADAAVAPDGTTTADTFVDTVDNDTHWISQGNQARVTSQKYTGCVYAKLVNGSPRNWIALGMWDGTNLRFAHFDLATGEVGTVSGGGTTARMHPADKVNGYWRPCITITSTGDSATGAMSVWSCEADNDRSYAGGGDNLFYLWGYKSEVGTTCTSHIKTEATAVTRAADDITIDLNSHPHYALPTTLTSGNLVTFAWDFRGLWSSSTDIGQTRTIWEISEDGEDSANRIAVEVQADGSIKASVHKSTGGAATFTSATDPVDYSRVEGVTGRLVLDFADMSNSELYVDGTASSSQSGNTGSFTLDISDAPLRLGQDYDGTVNGNLELGDLLILPNQATP